MSPHEEKVLKKTVSTVSQPQVESTRELGIKIRCNRAEDQRDGTFLLFFPTKSLTSEQHKVLEELFPNLGEQAYRLIDKEALLQSIVS